jgi:hypothetical protein
MEKFDLNIEKILENWDTHHAIREVIANALDEQLLTKTKDVEITKVGKTWLIKDYGRGLKYSDLTQNENQEKIKHPSTIGKFGIGLKDALATFDRKKIQVLIKSKFADITATQNEKHGFPNIKTLHAIIGNPSSPKLIGTEFIIEGVSDTDIQEAKNLFLKFSGEEILEQTEYGEVVRNTNNIGRIYINGVRAAEEPGFLFSYNITKKSKALQKALNRERTNVGRSAYSDIVKQILLKSKSTAVAEKLASEFQKINSGTAHYEMLNWKDVQVHAIKILNQTGKYVFLTQKQMLDSPNMIDEARNTGLTVMQITDTVSDSIVGLKDFSGNEIKGMSQFLSDYTDSFEFKFIDLKKLSPNEKIIYNYIPDIAKLFGGLPKKVKDIKVASQLRKDFYTTSETLGCWDEQTNSIVIHRKLLKSLSPFSGTLVHEIIHAKTGDDDVTREFENELTDAIGIMCEAALKGKKPSGKLK